MLKIFRKNHFLHSLLLLPLSILLHLEEVMGNTQPAAEDPGIFSIGLATFVENNPSLAGFFMALLIFFNAVLLNRLAIISRLSVKISLVPGAVYIVLSALVPDFREFSVLHFASFFLLLTIGNLFYCNYRHKVSGKIFNVGLFAGMCTLCWPPAIVFLLFGYVGMSILRTFKRNENLNLFNGFLLPFFLTAAYFFYIDKLPLFLEQQFSQGLGFPDFSPVEGTNWVFLALWALILVLSLLGYRAFTMKKDIHSRKKIDLFYWALLFSGISLLVSQEIHFTIVFMALPSISFFMAELLLLIKREMWAELIFGCLALLAFIHQFIPLTAS